MIQEAGPSTPVIVSGLSEFPRPVISSMSWKTWSAPAPSPRNAEAAPARTDLAGANRVTLDKLFDSMKAEEIKTINLIIKGDVQGLGRNARQDRHRCQHQRGPRPRDSHAPSARSTKATCELADASKAVIIGFHVVPDEAARQMAEQRRVEIRLYRVIYEIFDDLKKALSGLLEPEIREKLHGHAEIRKVYKVSRIGNVAGCFVTDGHIQRGSKIRLIRDGVVITQDLSLESLKRLKDDVKEVKAGFECGLKISGYDDIKIGDVLEAYVRETFQRTL